MNTFLICAIAVSILLSVDTWVSLGFVVFFVILLYRRVGIKVVLFALASGIVLCLSRLFYTLQSHMFKEAIEGIVIATGKNDLLIRDGFGTYYLAVKEHAYQVGDILRAMGKPQVIAFPVIEEAFNYNQYLNQKGCFIELQSPFIIEEFVLPIRIGDIRERFLAQYPKDTAVFIQSMLFKERSQSRFFITMNHLNLTYLCTVSGIHIHGWLYFMEKVFLLKIKKKTAKNLAYLTLLPLWFIEPNSISFIRIVFLYLIRCLNREVLQERFSTIECLCLTMMVILLIDPFAINQLGFQLGFGLSFFQLLIGPLVAHYKNQFRSFVRIILFFLVLIPFYLSQTYIIPLSNLFFSMLLTPFLQLAFTLSYANFLLFPTPRLMTIIIKTLDRFVQLIEPLSFHVTVGQIPVILITLLYLSILGLIYFDELRLFKIRNQFGAVFLLIITSVFGYHTLLSPNFVAFINVGQGDAILLKENQIAILIDTGGSFTLDTANEVLIPYFRRHGILDIDALIITHDDFDHAGAATSLIKYFDVKREVKRSDFPFRIGTMTIENLNPLNDEDENRSSLVLYTEFLQQKWLFMGDVPKEVEVEICLNTPFLQADFIKIGHHGSKTSTSKMLLETVRPKEAIVSCGKNNFYGHPHLEVIEMLESYRIKVRRTDIEGTIRYTSSGH